LKRRLKKLMNSEARTQLLNQLSRAVAAYNHALNRMIDCKGSLPPALCQQARQAREECHARRAALLEHARLQSSGLAEEQVRPGYRAVAPWTGTNS
jgi:hypothetical protein